MDALRWGVFTRDPRPGEEWSERFRWANGNLVALPGQQAAEARAAEIRALHPEWEVEARQTADPLPGAFREAFAELLPRTDDQAATQAAGSEEEEADDVR